MTDQRNKIIDEVCRVLRVEGQAIFDCAERLVEPDQTRNIEKAIKLLKQSLDAGGKIIVTGVGKSGKIGQKLAATLSSTGSLAMFLHPTEGLHGDLGVITPNDTILALSHTGNTEEIVRLLPSLKRLKVSIIGMGGNRQSKLAELTDAWIDTAIQQEACPHNLTPTTSTTLALAVGDALAIALMQLHGFDAASFAKNHPGGSLGKRLSLKVEDVMHSGDNVPVVAPESSIDEVLVKSTQKKLGAVLVVEGKKMAGIITDGDIRRALQHKERFFSFTATEPVTAKPEMMAYEALEIMENRPSQISVLPVVDNDNNWLGLLRLHDLVRTF